MAARASSQKRTSAPSKDVTDSVNKDSKRKSSDKAHSSVQDNIGLKMRIEAPDELEAAEDNLYVILTPDVLRRSSAPLESLHNVINKRLCARGVNCSSGFQMGWTPHAGTHVPLKDDEDASGFLLSLPAQASDLDPSSTFTVTLQSFSPEDLNDGEFRRQSEDSTSQRSHSSASWARSVDSEASHIEGQCQTPRPHSDTGIQASSAPQSSDTSLGSGDQSSLHGSDDEEEANYGFQCRESATPGADNTEDRAAFQDLYANLPNAAQLSEENVQAFCHDFNIKKPASWDPCKVVKVIGLAIDVKGYQLYSVWWMLRHEAKYKVGGCLAHEPGLGKSRIVILVCVLSLFMRHAKQLVEEAWESDSKKHLHKDTTDLVATCPSNRGYHAQKGDHALRPRCFCEPGTRYLYDGLDSGANCIISPPSLIGNWNDEVAKVLKGNTVREQTGSPIVTLTAHYNATNQDNFAMNAKKFRSQNATLEGWHEANKHYDLDDIKWELSRAKTKLTEPHYNIPECSHVIVITSMQSLPTQLINAGKAVKIPGVDSKLPCRKDQGYCLHGSAKCKAMTHTVKEKAKSVFRFPVARVFADESHSYKSGQQFNSHVTEVLHWRPEALTAYWPVTGTPLCSGPSDVLIPFKVQERTSWHEDLHLKMFTKAETEQIRNLDELHREQRQRIDISHKDFLKLVPGDGPTLWQKAGNSADKDDKDSYKTTRRADLEKAIHEAFQKGVVDVVAKWMEEHMIQLRSDAKFNGKAIVELPKFTPMTTPLKPLTKEIAELHKLIDDYSLNCGRLIQLRKAAAKGRTSDKKSIGKAVNKVAHSFRLTMVCLVIPALLPLLREHPEWLLSKTIREKRWWTDPGSSPLAEHIDALYQSSPHLQHVVKRARERKKVEKIIQYSDDRLRTKELRIEHYDKFLVAVFEPILAFCTLLVLRSKLQPRYQGDAKAVNHAIQPLYEGQGSAAFTAGFQLDGPDKAEVASIDIGVLLTRVGGLGLTLTAADLMIQMDVEADMTRDKQVSARIWRIGQQRDVVYEQLISTRGNLHKTLIEHRERGNNIHNLILTKKKSGPGAKRKRSNSSDSGSHSSQGSKQSEAETATD